MKTNENMWPEQVVNLSINRKKKEVYVHFRPISLMEREYQVLEWIMREQNPETRLWFADIAHRAFPRTEMVAFSSIYVILRNIKKALVAHGASRGFIRVPASNRVQLYSPDPSVKVTAFHVPAAKFTAGPKNGSLTPSRDEVEPVWEGQMTEKADALILEQLFTYLNQDDRPNGRFAPSMSVGDVVTIAGNTIEAVSYQVANVGWIHLNEPVHADADAVDAMKKKLTGRPQTVALS